jgi:glycosyltransferase involved in cell wall biosynthesis
VRVLVVSGIWPPDVGGPASSSPELAELLLGRGHVVSALTTAAAPPPAASYPVHWVGRSLPPGVRHAAFVARVARLAREADVVYTASVLGRSAAGCVAARTPYVVKLPDDPAFERARRLGLYDGDLDGFQRHGGGLRVRALRRVRDLALRRAARVVCPSAYLAALAAGWGVRQERLVVVPNPAPALPELAAAEEVRARLGLGPGERVLVSAGRLNAQKALHVALEALARLEGVSLVLAGDGELRDALAARAGELGLDVRVRFAGSLPRVEVLALFRAADAVLLSSAWENFPHVLVEALAVGTPVVATRVGGVAEIVEDGVSGLLVPAGDPEALADAAGRLLADAGLHERLRAGTAGSVARFAPEPVYERLEAVLEEAAAG